MLMTSLSAASVEILADPEALVRRVADWLLAAATEKDGLFAVADRENGRVLLFRVGALPVPSDVETDAYRGSVQAPEDVVATPSG